MRRVLLPVAVLAALLAAAGLLVALRGNDEGVPSTGRVFLVGDSLNVGIEPSLPRVLPGWQVETDDVVGRSTADGLEALERAGAGLAPRVVVSLGTNDPAGDVDGFARHVTRAMALVGGRRCVVWVTIHRDGDAYEPFNEILRSEAGKRSNLVLVDWARMVDESPGLLAADGVHATPEGYLARAEAVADAVRSCPVGERT